MTVWRIISRSREFEPIETHRKKHDGVYQTPTMIGVKWQIDVKFVPSSCKSPKMEPAIRYYQCTVIDECSRKRFLYWSDEHSGYEAAKALRAAVRFFGYKPAIVQSDNGEEFCHPRKADASQGPHAFEIACKELGIARMFQRYPSRR
jgi:transposase InsO family protein